MGNLEKIINTYDSIIYELFIFMGAIIIYGVLCRQWIFTAIFGISVLTIYLITNKQIKEIKKALE